MLDRRPAPFVVIEGPPGCGDGIAARLAVEGHRVVDAFRAPLDRSGAICRGVVDGPDSAADALLAALDGAGLLVEASADRATIDRLVDDLRRLGPVDHRATPPAPMPALDPEARAILGLLAEGHTLGEAAALLGLARRTADRRLAAARDALGVERTTEAIARARRLGWLGGGR
jgi:DNA-binding NarL/FixJ family response regulator